MKKEAAASRVSGYSDRRIFKIAKRFLAACIALLFIASAVPGLWTVSSAESNVKNVRVAMDDSGMFITKDASGNPAGGYAYEYIQSVAAYAGWRVEYVALDTFSECAQALLDGTVDLMYDVSYTPERESLFLFPQHRMGTEDYYLYALEGNTRLRSGDDATLNGKTVGVTEGTNQITMLTEWCARKGVSLAVRKFASITEKEAALEAGEIDLDYEISMLAKEHYSAVAKVGSDDFYLVANKNRADLTGDIDYALDKITGIEPYFIENLNRKYFSKSTLNRTLSREELAFVESHPVLKVGYPDDCMPLSGKTKAGTVNGVVKDIVPYLFANIGLRGKIDPEFICYADSAQMLAALAAGEIDLCFPVYDSIEYGIRHGVSISASVVEISANLVCRIGYGECTTGVIAVEKNNTMQEGYVKGFYPNANIVYCDSAEACMDAVQSGKAGCTVMDALRMSRLLSDEKYKNFTEVQLLNPFSFCFAVDEGNTALLSLVNRTIACAEKEYAYNLAYSYIGEAAESRLAEFINEHKLPLIIGLCVLILLIVAGTVFTVTTIKKSRRKMAEIRRVDDTLLGKYDAVYIIDLDRNEIHPTKSSRVSNVGAFTGPMCFTDLALQFAQTVGDAYKQDWERFADISYMKEFMREQDSREFTYELPGTEKTLRRMTIDVLERVNGEASVLLFAFVGVDDASAKAISLQKRLAEQNVFTGYFLDPYESAYYIDLKNHTYRNFKRYGSEPENVSVREGYPQAFKKYFEENVHPDDLAEVLALAKPEELREKLRESSGFSITFRRVARSGLKYYSCEVIRGADADHVAIGFRDITANVKKQEEQLLTEELANQQRTMKDFGDMVNAALWNVDIGKDGIIAAVRWSDEFRIMLGFEPTEADFANTLEAWKARLHPEDRERVVAYYTGAATTAAPEELNYDIKYRIIRKNGECRWYRAVGRHKEAGEGHRTLFGIIFDITADVQLEEKQKQLEEALDLANMEAKRIETLMGLANAARWNFEIGADDKYVNVNYKVGENGEDFVAAKTMGTLSWLDSVHPDDREKMTNSFNKAAHDHTGADDYYNSFRVLGEDGKYHWLKSAGKVYRRADGSGEFYGMSIDFSKQIEEREEQQRKVEDALNKLTLETQRSDALMKLSNAMRWSFGIGADDRFTTVAYDDENYIKQFEIVAAKDPLSWLDGIHPEDRERVKAVYYKAAHDHEGNRDYVYDFRSMGADGKYHWVKSAARVFRYADGTGEYSGMSVDITEQMEEKEKQRQTLEDALNKLTVETQRSDVLMKLVNAMKWTFEISADDRFTAVDFDDAEYAAQYTIDNDRDPLSWLESVHPEDKEKTISAFMEAAHDHECKKCYTYSYRAKGAHGEWRRIKQVGKVMRRADGSGCYYGMTIDFTEEMAEKEQQQKKLEEALNAAQAASKAKTAFLFNMSHDIRTPMNAILGFTDMAEKSAREPEKVLEYLGKTRQAGNLLLSLINSVLEMSRIEAGKAELDEKPARVDFSFVNVDASMQTLATAKKIDLTFEYGPVEDNFIYVDIDRANRILINLISNAIKYTNEGGSVRVHCEQLGKSGEHGIYRYTIKDNGIGMSEEFQKHLFEEFARENSSTDSGVEGSGLGLAVAKSFVDLMHGKIECESKKGVGTTFTITLPLRLQEDVENAHYIDPATRELVGIRSVQKEKKPFELEGKRVLLVEDNEMNREIALFMLEEQKMIVEQAEDGNIAVDMLKEKGPEYYDAILMDIQMPMMDGYTATKKIREMYPDAKLPIVAVSANAFAEDRAASLAAGMDGHIAKPINTAELFETLSKLV